MDNAPSEAKLQDEIDQFKQAILELQERYDMLLEQSMVQRMKISENASPDEILRVAMINAELSTQREAQQFGIEQALAIMQGVLGNKERQLEQLRKGQVPAQELATSVSQLRQRAETVNQLAIQLKTELAKLRTLAQDIEVPYRTLYGCAPLDLQPTFLRTIPYVIQTGQTFRVVGIDEAQRTKISHS